MSNVTDAEFLTNLQTMAHRATPQLSVPGADAIIPAARRRKARRRSVVSSAAGIALLAGAGVSHLAGTIAPAQQYTAESVVAQDAAVPTVADGPIEPAMTRMEGSYDVEEHSAEIADAIEQSNDWVEVGDQGVGASDFVVVEAAPAIDTTNPSNPWTIGLLTGGAGALAASAAITIAAKRKYATTRIR
jgi:hypothetical protein